MPRPTDHTDERAWFDWLAQLDTEVQDAELSALASNNPELVDKLRRLLAAHERAQDAGSVIGPSAPEPDMPESVGPYRLLEKIGEGGMGVIYLAEQREPVRRRVAIKIIRPGMASRDVLQRFSAERQALALMSHPGIAAILDGGETEQGLPYFVMEHVQGTPITKYCDAHRLDIRERAQLMRKVCIAVQHAHQKGIIHRDLKPSNILVTEENGEVQPKIIDFGVAKAIAQPLTDDTLHTRFGHMIGTPDYMSPEQCAPGNIDIDTRSDIYSLGAILFELFCGQLPFDFHGRRMSEPEILAELQRFEAPRLLRKAALATTDNAENRGLVDVAALCRYLRCEPEWIVAKALASERNRRYESAQAMADDLQRFLRNEAIVAGPPTFGYRARKFARRHALGVSAIATSFLVLVIFSVMMTRQVEQTRAERDRANREATIARAMTEFTAGLFTLANPELSGSSEILARDLLDAGVRRLEIRNDQFDPAVRSALLHQSGDAYRGLGEYDRARQLLGLALEEQQLAGADPNTIARILMSIASLEIRLGEFREAEGHLRRSIASIDAGSLELSDQEVRLSAEVQLARVLKLESRLDEAVALLEPIVSNGRIEIALPAVYGDACLALGDVRYQQGEMDESIRLFERAIEFQSGNRGDLADQTLGAKSKLATALATKGELVAAEKTLREVVAANRRIYGDRHAAVGVALNDLANVLSESPATMDAAIEAYREGLDILTDAFGEMHPEVATIYNNIGVTFLYQEKWQDAELAYKDAIRIRDVILGRDHMMTAGARIGRALALNKLDRFAEAERLLRDGVDAFERHVGEHAWRTANARTYLGTVLANQGEFAEAEQQLDMAHADLVEGLGTDHWRTLNAEMALGELYEKMNRLEEAERILVHAHQVFNETLGPEHTRTRRALERLQAVQALRQRG